jgi:class 3 adenylate cyclase/predicted ATPase
VSYTPRHLVERILAEQTARESRGAVEGERKTITALFADIKNSMNLIEDLDPEEARDVIDPALRLMMDAVHRYEGYVAQSTGDGIFALFGAPLACEDHPQRALYAALRMQEESKHYAEVLRREKGINFQIRVGLNTGEVVVRSIHRDDLHTDYIPIGHSTSLAARMESLATPGSIVVSEYTQRLTEGYFEFRSLGPARIKGVSEPVHIYEVLGVGPVRTRLQIAARRGFVRFVGRQAELKQLQRALEQAKAGHGNIVAVQGAPGVGKSRLFHEFKLAAASGCLLLATFSVSHGKSSAYLPLIDLLKGYFQFTPHDDERKRREKIIGKVLTLDRSLEDTLPYLFALLRIPEPGFTPAQLDPQAKRQRMFSAIARLLLRESQNQPLILICEDLHWLDSETQAFLTLLTESIPHARLLLLVNYRPEYQHPWGGNPYYTQLRLEPLGQQEAAALLSALLDQQSEKQEGDALQPLTRLILEKTEGNPFFMEEIVLELVEQGVLGQSAGETRTQAPLPANLHIPPTIQAVLAARIDRLPPQTKSLLQTLAVIGKEFSLSLLTHLVEQPEDDLQRLLTQLRKAEFIYQQPTAAEIEYSFIHALTQEVAYNSLLTERRRALHERTAGAIEAVFSDRLEDHYDELAHHYRHSGNTEKALEYLQRAGEQAVQRSAYLEAIEQLTTALELLTTLPDTLPRRQRELTLRVSLGIPLVITKGFASLEVGEMYTRALELAQQTKETAHLFPVLRGLWEFCEVRGALQTAQSLGEHLLYLAQREQDPELLLVAHGALADTLLWCGSFRAARHHAEQASALYNLQQHQSLAFLYGGHDPGMASLVWKALALWHLGYPDQAALCIHRALPVLEKLAHPYSTVHALSFTAMLYQFLRRDQAVQEWTEAAFPLSHKHGFTYYAAMETILHGWVLTEQGQGEAGIAQMHEGLTTWRATGAELLRPYYLALLAEAYGEGGKPEQGIQVLDEALTGVHKSVEHWWEAELYRLKGELVLKSDVSDPKSTVAKTG